MGKYEDQSGDTQIAMEFIEQPPKPNRITPSKLARLIKTIVQRQIDWHKNEEKNRIEKLHRDRTILLRIEVVMKFSEAAVKWLESIKSPKFWLTREEGIEFFKEYKEDWNEALKSSVEPIFHEYFYELGISKEELPSIEIYASRTGSWVIKAALTMFASVGIAYTILKAVSEIPKIADGLIDLRDRVVSAFNSGISEKAIGRMKQVVQQNKLPTTPPQQLIECDVKIDSSPLLKLQSIAKAPMESLPRRTEFAQRDYELVHAEIGDIKSRTNVFLGTLVAIGTGGLVILCSLGAAEAISWPTWVPFATLIPLGLFTSAIFVTINGARETNKRLGYMETLAEYLAKGTTPSYFCGWTKAYNTGKRCEIYCAGGKQPTCNIGNSCTAEAKRLASKNTRRIRLIPSFLSSFTSLTGYIYIGGFLVSIIAFLCALMAMAKHSNQSFVYRYYIASVLFGVVITIFIVLTRLPTLYSDVRERSQLTELLFKVYAHGAVLMLPLLTLLLIFCHFTKYLPPFLALFTYLHGAVIAIVAIIAMKSFFVKLGSLRRGKYSTERWRHIWELRFNHCELMVASFPQSQT